MIKNENGFSLLEVLIALVIFSFGLLGIAALMAKGLQYNTSALHRSYAVTQAYDMADRMRANQLGLAAGNYNSITGAGVTDPGCIATATGCSPAQMAQYDAWQWNTDALSASNAVLLPGGSGTVSTAGGVYTITVIWDDDHDGAADDNFIFQFQP
ncbi:MAG: type IV pilus modification protein PilV [Arenicellales bacterium]|jgi:type IV pilus assembly protein PilV|nr:type IV pilus modification protein PilV [Arenicellales bacterium]MDP6314116.1 type IV pilus modification protein PilV [Arenicellales bacterium]MDP7119933.1 type IV pilus modification protein PilV [Arenicellales bacterium]MDP7192098.1 type IV pilus modification protein PilV [Arenicellales bacterium]MDP7489779.1 type IV pilus modification protein PilV [Arenicellales bacterium]|tara:strand:+ start:1682 stop:2146 length:465 start_codon:yes stop_codon:yes gene_type:complete